VLLFVFLVASHGVSVFLGLASGVASALGGVSD
jgi:hypothetical protein